MNVYAQRERVDQSQSHGHDHSAQVDENEFAHNHLDHIQAYRRNSVCSQFTSGKNSGRSWFFKTQNSHQIGCNPAIF